MNAKTQSNKTTRAVAFVAALFTSVVLFQSVATLGDQAPAPVTVVAHAGTTAQR